MFIISFSFYSNKMFIVHLSLYCCEICKRGKNIIPLPIVLNYNTLKQNEWKTGLKIMIRKKVTGHDKQTVILDESLTAETDELDPAFEEAGPTQRTDEYLPEDDDDLFPIEEDLQAMALDRTKNRYLATMKMMSTDPSCIYVPKNP